MKGILLLLIIVLRATMSLGQGLYGYYISKAREHLQYGELDKASYFIEKGIKMYPDSSDLFIVRAFQYHSMDSVNNSIADLFKAKEMGSTSEFIPKFLGLNYDEIGSFDLAKKNYEEYLSLVPDDLSVVICLVNLLAKEGLYLEAEEMTLEIKNSYPKSAEPNMLFGIINHERGMYSEAVEFFTEYIKLTQGSDPIGYLHRSYAHRAMGMLTEMCEDLWSIRWDYTTNGSGLYRVEDCEKILNRANSPPTEDTIYRNPPAEKN